MIVATEVIEELLAGLPDLQAGTLRSRPAAEAAFTNVAWANYLPKPTDQEWAMVSGLTIDDKTKTFQLYKVAEATAPKAGDRFVDVGSVVWEVKNVRTKMMGYIFDLLCVADVT